MTAPLEVHQFPCLSDNYGYLVHDAETGNTAVIDTPEVAPIMAGLAEKGWQLTHILNTHHHGDHAGGNLEIKDKTGCEIVGPRADAERIPGIDTALGDGDELSFGGRKVRVFDTPGHTKGHICYHFEADGLAFVGDTLFALGCGRLFEGTPAQMWTSLSKLLRWPDDTVVYCAHEYTQANARFALSVEPDNQTLQERAVEIDRLRAEGLPTVPTTMGLERATNPFLRPDSADLQRTIGLEGADLVEVFAKTRALKDSF
ncbi:MAG: hydroxyacylglutathione hydrolase [Gammaproteobacteria bacterium]|nr:hydroxyacylglutathione hydrolase [Gammaproteobacteria bacterium]